MDHQSKISALANEVNGVGSNELGFLKHVSYKIVLMMVYSFSIIHISTKSVCHFPTKICDADAGYFLYWEGNCMYIFRFTYKR